MIVVFFFLLCGSSTIRSSSSLYSSSSYYILIFVQRCIELLLLFSLWRLPSKFPSSFPSFPFFPFFLQFFFTHTQKLVTQKRSLFFSHPSPIIIIIINLILILIIEWSRTLYFNRRRY